ncbi:MAG: hypothetical protein ACI4GO_06765 [Hominenteromicrobium sp.]
MEGIEMHGFLCQNLFMDKLHGLKKHQKLVYLFCWIPFTVLCVVGLELVERLVPIRLSNIIIIPPTILSILWICSALLSFVSNKTARNVLMNLILAIVVFTALIIQIIAITAELIAA